MSTAPEQEISDLLARLAAVDEGERTRRHPPCRADCNAPWGPPGEVCEAAPSSHPATLFSTLHNDPVTPAHPVRVWHQASGVDGAEHKPSRGVPQQLLFDEFSATTPQAGDGEAGRSPTSSSLFPQYGRVGDAPHGGGGSLRSTPIQPGYSGVGNLDGFVSWVQSQTPTGAAQRSSSAAAAHGGAGGLGGSFHDHPAAQDPSLQQHHPRASPWRCSSNAAPLLAMHTPPRTTFSVSAGGGAAGAHSSPHINTTHGLVLPAQLTAQHHHWTSTPPHHHFNAPGGTSKAYTPAEDASLPPWWKSEHNAAPATTSRTARTPPPPLLSSSKSAALPHQLDPTAAAFDPTFATTPPTRHLGGNPATIPLDRCASLGSGMTTPTCAQSLGSSSIRRGAPMFYSNPRHASAGTSPQMCPLSRPPSAGQHHHSSITPPPVPLIFPQSEDTLHPNMADYAAASVSPTTFGHSGQSTRQCLPPPASNRHHHHLVLQQPPSPAGSLGTVLCLHQPSSTIDASPVHIAEYFRGRVVEAAKDQSGCRALQKFFQESPDFNAPEVHYILDEISPHHSVELMSDAYGNFLIQKILECAPDQVRLRITADVAPSLAAISTTPHGTFAVQKLVESLRSDEETAIVCAGLGQNVPLLLNDINGGHVVQKVLQCIPPHHRQFLFDGIAMHTTRVCNHKQGCCVVQKCLDQATAEQFLVVQRAAVSAAHPETLVALMCDPYGNYVVSKLLERGLVILTPQQRVAQLGGFVDAVAQAITAMDLSRPGGLALLAGGGCNSNHAGNSPHHAATTPPNSRGSPQHHNHNHQQPHIMPASSDIVLHLCTDKFSSNVMEKLLKANAGLPSFDTLVSFIVGSRRGGGELHQQQQQQQPRTLRILFGGSGNYVVQAALTLSPVPLPRQLFRASTPPPLHNYHNNGNNDVDLDNKPPSDVSCCNLAQLVESLLPSMSLISQQNFGKKVEVAMADALGRLLQAGYVLPERLQVPHVLQSLMSANNVEIFSLQTASSSGKGSFAGSGGQHSPPWRQQHSGSVSQNNLSTLQSDGSRSSANASTPVHRFGGLLLPHGADAPSTAVLGSTTPTQTAVAPHTTTPSNPFAAAFGVFEAGVDVTPPRANVAPLPSAITPPPPVAFFTSGGAASPPNSSTHDSLQRGAAATEPQRGPAAASSRSDAANLRAGSSGPSNGWHRSGTGNPQQQQQGGSSRRRSHKPS